MKEQISESGIEIENTLSMSLRSEYTGRNQLWLIFLTFAGIFSSVFTFLTMFSPVYSPPVLVLFLLAETGFFSFFILKGRKGSGMILITLLLYCFLLLWQKKRISSGMMYLTNTICQTIYMTDWEYFTPSAENSEITSVTCLLCFLTVPIVCMVCYAVLKYQNFFLSFLVTFPFAEIGLFFGIVPDHFFAAMLASFWFSMLAVQMASSGITQNGGKTGFLRRKNAFFPVSGMRFMLSEITGISIFLFLLILFFTTEQTVKLTDYQRPEKIKQMRTDFQNYVSSHNWTDFTLLEHYGDEQSLPDGNQIQLGELEEKIYENTPVSNISFSDNPESRIYLRYRTGHVYTGRSWTLLPAEKYQETAIFSDLDYYPPEFLYASVAAQKQIQMSLYHTTGILTQCIPYGFQKNKNILCSPDDAIKTETSIYVFGGGQNYEDYFLNPALVQKYRTGDLLPFCDAETISILSGLLTGKEENKIWMTEEQPGFKKTHPSKAAEAAILCGSFYDDFVYDTETAVPDTPSMAAVRNQYAFLWENFDARNASPEEIILLLQSIRDQICKQVSYTLAPGKTPPDRDHVAWFLLENQKGYCEHYATAGTILARMAGIPARYCEGYMIDCSRPGVLHLEETDSRSILTSEILDSNAHAWTEIYLSGIGWIPFEFTFSYFSSPAVQIETQPITEAKHSIIMTEPIVTTPTTPVTEPPAPEPVEKISTHYLILFIILITAAILCTMILIFRIIRLIALRRREDAISQDDKKAAAKYVYQYLTELMQECGVQTKTTTIGELVSNAEQQCSEYLHNYSISAAVQLGAKLRYSPHPTTKSELLYLYRTSKELADSMYENAAFFRRFYLKWLRHYL